MPHDAAALPVQARQHGHFAHFDQLRHVVPGLVAMYIERLVAAVGGAAGATKMKEAKAVT
ncbi:MAG: hypothetical protein EOO32_02980 [Comamonadaceae bacterium]|nr:MAG: hypothetical protein EOO32_02980 [Comamonadaceae bacterium]